MYIYLFLGTLGGLLLITLMGQPVHFPTWCYYLGLWSGVMLNNLFDNYQTAKAKRLKRQELLQAAIKNSSAEDFEDYQIFVKLHEQGFTPEEIRKAFYDLDKKIK
jgi:hypothetical protein